MSARTTSPGIAARESGPFICFIVSRPLDQREERAGSVLITVVELWIKNVRFCTIAEQKIQRTLEGTLKLFDYGRAGACDQAGHAEGYSSNSVYHGHALESCAGADKGEAMYRRSFSTLALATLAGLKVVHPAAAEDASGDLQTQLQRFKGFPGTTSFRIDVGDDTVAAKAPKSQLFVASTIKTFIVCQYLRDVEAGRLSEDEQLPVNDSVRTVDSPVFLNLTGTTWARSILEAMITHSDNTATDIALLRVGPDRVRSFIADAGLHTTLIPDSTRRFFSYNYGAPLGVDLGWAGLQQALRQPPGPLHPPLNDQETMASSASDMVSYYKRALAGQFFTKPATLTEFKRIHLTNLAFPDDTIGYAKGGNLDTVATESSTVADFHAQAYAGQMVVNATPVTFCFVVNWTSVDPNSTSTTLTPAFVEVVKGSLEAIKRQLLA